MPETDVCAAWLRSGRDGGSARMRAENLSRPGAIRDLILDRAGIQPGETVLDAETGDAASARHAMTHLRAWR